MKQRAASSSSTSTSTSSEQREDAAAARHGSPRRRGGWWRARALAILAASALLLWVAAIHWHVGAIRGRRVLEERTSGGAAATGPAPPAPPSPPRPSVAAAAANATAAAAVPADPRTAAAAPLAAGEGRGVCLSFVHITKTGGIAIEKLAARHGVAWGACAWITNSPPFDTVCSGIADKYNRWRHDRGELTPWHNPGVVPRQYACPRLFAVVRNPYTRLVSEFYSPWGGWPGQHSGAISAEAMNGWIVYHITHLAANSGNGQWDWAFHGARQVSYLLAENGGRKVQHVVHFESIAADFDKLMKAYRLPMRYDPRVVNDSHLNRTVTVFNLTDSTVDVINSVYARDFAVLRYAPKRRDQDWTSYDFSANVTRVHWS